MGSGLDELLTVTNALIALNVVVSLPGFWALRRKRYRPLFVFMPSKHAPGRSPVGALLSSFAHGDVWHLLVNMIALYFFGPHVELALGPGPYLLLYVVSGVGSTLAVWALRHNNPRHATLGASGSIAGVLFASAVVVPTASVYLFFIPIPIPAPVFAIIYLVISSFMVGSGDRVSHEAHIGGAVTGFLLAGLLSDTGFAPFIREVSSLLS